MGMWYGHEIDILQIFSSIKSFLLLAWENDVRYVTYIPHILFKTFRL